MFYAKDSIGPVRPLSARETLEKFAGSWARQQGPELRPSRPDIVPNDPHQQTGQPEARRAEMRGDDAREARRGEDSRQQQANDSDRTEATGRNNAERGRNASRGRGRGGRTR